MNEKPYKYVVVCENCAGKTEKANQGCHTLKEARQIRRDYEEKYPFIPGEFCLPTTIYYLKEWTLYHSYGGSEQYRTIDDLTKII